MNIGEYIKEKRTTKQMSQRDLAAASGLSNAEISRIESGKRKDPSTKVLKLLANALNTPFEEVLSETGIIENGQTLYNHLVKEYGSDIIQVDTSLIKLDNHTYILVDDLSDDEINDVKKYIQFIKSKR